MIGTIGSPKNDESEQSTTGVADEAYVTRGIQLQKRSRLNRGEQAKLRRLIQGPVAAMTAEQLSIDLDTGLEDDPRYEHAISSVYNLVLKSGSRVCEITSSVETTLPPNAPQPLKILVVEAVARQLGRAWCEDTASFVDVTIASAKLQDVAQALALKTVYRRDRPQPFAVILLPEGEQHSLMSFMTGALFQSFGWQQQVFTHDEATQSQIADAVAKSNAICIGWSNIRLKPQVTDLIKEVKLKKGAHDQPLIAGGKAALESVDFLVEMGIDSICDSAYSAVKIAENFNSLEIINHFATPVGNKRNHMRKRIDWQNP